jgi:hypothetical protein
MMMSDKAVIDTKKKAISNAFKWLYNFFEKQQLRRKALKNYKNQKKT